MRISFFELSLHLHSCAEESFPVTTSKPLCSPQQGGREEEREAEKERENHSGMITNVKNFKREEIRPHSATMEGGLKGKDFSQNPKQCFED